MSRAAAELALRKQYGPIGTYGTTRPDGRPTITGARAQQDFATPAFGQYEQDSEAKDELRAVYKTMEAVSEAQREMNGRDGVQRQYDLQPSEVAVVKEAIETQKKKKWEQYWWAQTDPAKPWTMSEVAKVAPELVATKLAAIKEISQFALDTAIIKHIGHGGDPHLATLQYMCDQGMMNHMPHLLTIDKATYTPGPMSIFKFLAMGGENTEYDSTGHFDDQGVKLARTGRQFTYPMDREDGRAVIPVDGRGGAPAEAIKNVFSSGTRAQRENAREARAF
jgi:hypothetical protein